MIPARPTLARCWASFCCALGIAASMGCLNPRPDLDPSRDDSEPVGGGNAGSGGAGNDGPPLGMAGSGPSVGGGAGAGAVTGPDVPDAGVDAGGAGPDSGSEDAGDGLPEAGIGGGDGGR